MQWAKQERPSAIQLGRKACVEAPPVKRKMEVKRKAACTCSAELMDVERGFLHESKQSNELLKELNSKWTPCWQ
ncbi:hypothetical protein MAR_027278 [Mya arenaria]|uniref:Uncharacterized protein n=1 Tax=Mya arenaria TaxID=6604 RepID=A0ABY7ET12_MYAAR|nr:hypothetical protein MAR_027278 [Mya arenaria]